MKLDLHSEMILDEYRAKQPVFERLKTVVEEQLRRCLDENNIIVSGLEARIKTEKSLAGKLELKGYKYHTLDDITDIGKISFHVSIVEDTDLFSCGEAFCQRVYRCKRIRQYSQPKYRQSGI